MNRQQFKQAAGITGALTDRWFSPIDAALKERFITAPKDIAMFIAQCGHESAGFNRIVENLNYTPSALLATFGTRRITRYQAEMLGRTNAHKAQQEAIANVVYGGEWGLKNLGNKERGDGWLYRGRGLIQLTGRSNYTTCSKALHLDLIADPDLLLQDDIAAKAAVWFYVWRGCLLYSGDTERVTKLINGGRNGVDDRKLRYKRAMAALA